MFALLRPARKRRKPSARNLEIYEAFMFQAKTQQELSEQYDLAQSRVSQIIASVEGWRASTAAAERGELPPEQDQRHEQWLSRQWNHQLIRRNIRAFDESNKPLTTTKTITVSQEPEAEEPKNQGEVGGQRPEVGGLGTKVVRVETTVREQRANASFLRNAFAANKELARQSELPVKAEPKPEENYQQEHRLVNDWLWRQRRKREDEGKVVRSTDPGTFVNNWLAVLLGDNPGILTPGFAPPGPAVKEVVRRFVLQRIPIRGQQPGGERFVEEVLGEPIGDNHPMYKEAAQYMTQPPPCPAPPASSQPPADSSIRDWTQPEKYDATPVPTSDYGETDRFYSSPHPLQSYHRDYVLDGAPDTPAPEAPWEAEERRRRLRQHMQNMVFKVTDR
jgi:hypothetical protein